MEPLRLVPLLAPPRRRGEVDEGGLGGVAVGIVVNNLRKAVFAD